MYHDAWMPLSLIRRRYDDVGMPGWYRRVRIRQELIGGAYDSRRRKQLSSFEDI